jgi:hypothetical protein
MSAEDREERPPESWLAEAYMDGGIRVGHSDASPSATRHIRGVAQGNTPGNYESSPGHLPDGRSTARRSTAINAADREPILPDMPNLSPA